MSCLAEDASQLKGSQQVLTAYKTKQQGTEGQGSSVPVFLSLIHGSLSIFNLGAAI